MTKRMRSSRVASIGAMVSYGGAPLALRVRPSSDSRTKRRSYPYLMVVTHHLAKVRRNGLPEARYNESLMDLDTFVINVLSRRGQGVAVLVETLGGRRNYYAYVRSRVVGARARKVILAQQPDHKLSFRGRADPKWSVFEEYHRQFPW